MANPILNEPDIRMADLRGSRSGEMKGEATANLITGLAKTGFAIDQGLAEARLERQLVSAQQAYTNEANVGAAGPQSVLEDTDFRTYSGVRLNATENPQYPKELEAIRTKLGDNLSAYQQGTLSTLAFQARVEDITRKAIASRPGLRRELTAIAASTLGFDPTGVQLKQLMAQATKEAKEGRFEKGRGDTQEALGREYEAAKARNPEGGHESWMADANALIGLRQQQDALDKQVLLFKSKEYMSQGDAAAINSAYQEKLDNTVSELIYSSSPMQYASQEAWDGALKSVSSALDAGVDNVAQQYRQLPGWNIPGTRAALLKGLDQMREENRDLIAQLSGQRAKAIDAKTGSVNQALLSEKLRALMYVKAALKGYPEVYNLGVVTGWDNLAAALPRNMQSNMQLHKALNVLHGAAVPPTPATTTPQDSAPSGRPNVRAERSNQSISRYLSGEPPVGNEDTALFYSGAGNALASLFTDQPDDRLTNKANVKMGSLLDDANKSLYVAGGGVQLPGGRYAQFAPIEPNGDPRSTRPEEALLNVANMVSNNKARLDKMDTEGQNKLMGYLNTGYQAYATQLLTNSRKVFTEFSEGGRSPQQLAGLKVVTTAGGVPQLVVEKRGEGSPSAQSKVVLSTTTLANRYNQVLRAMWQLPIDDAQRGKLMSTTNNIVSAWGS